MNIKKEYNRLNNSIMRKRLELSKMVYNKKDNGGLTPYQLQEKMYQEQKELNDLIEKHKIF